MPPVVANTALRRWKTAGAGFFKYPISWSIGCALGLFLLFSNGFGKVKFGSKSKLIKLITKAGFVPAIIVAGVIAMIIGERSAGLLYGNQFLV